MIYDTFMNKMGHKSSTSTYWTILELKGLLEDEESCVYYEKHRKHIGMHPSHVRNVTLALREILNSKLNSFEPDLNGLLLAYKNPTLLSPYAGTLHDSCYIHMDIEADFYIFKPKVGSKLKGFVNKIGLNHVGVLVHKVFIASIPQPEDEEDWPGNKVNIGQEIRFTVNQIDFRSKLPYIRGVLHEDEYLEGCKLFNKQMAENDKATKSSEQKNISFSEDLIADPSGVSARKRKRITFDSDSEDNEDKSVEPNNLSSQENGFDTERKPKIKKSHKKAKKSEDDEINEWIDSKKIHQNSTGESSKMSSRKKKRNVCDSDSELERNNKSNISLSDEKSQEIENDSEMEDRKSKIRKSQKKAKKYANSQETESEEIEDENSKMKKSQKKVKQSKQKIKVEYESDEMEKVLRNIKTEPSETSVKIKKEPKTTKYANQKQEDSD